jgi:hypothetical protein
MTPPDFDALRGLRRAVLDVRDASDRALSVVIVADALRDQSGGADGTVMVRLADWRQLKSAIRMQDALAAGLVTAFSEAAELAGH